MKPGPRPLGHNLKTSVRILGRQVDQFEALCHLRRRRPFELAAEFVVDGIRKALEDPATAASVAELVTQREHHREQQRLLEQGRTHRSGFRLIEGDGA